MPNVESTFGAGRPAWLGRLDKGSLASVTGGEVYDAVLLLGVLMYLQASEPVIAELRGGGPLPARR